MIQQVQVNKQLKQSYQIAIPLHFTTMPTLLGNNLYHFMHTLSEGTDMVQSLPADSNLVYFNLRLTETVKIR